MSASVHQRGTVLVVTCELCDELEVEFPATASDTEDQDRADTFAALHDSEVHPTGRRPEWAEVARWAASHNLSGARS